MHRAGSATLRADPYIAGPWPTSRDCIARARGICPPTTSTASSRGAQSRAGARRHLRRRAAAHHRRRGHREDPNARLPRRAPDRARRPPRADPPAHVHPPRRAGDARARRAARRAPRGARSTAGRSTPPATGCSGGSARAAGLPADFTIMDQGDAEDLMQLARAQPRHRARRRSAFPKKETLHYVYSRHVNTEIPVDEILHDEYPQFRRVRRSDIVAHLRRLHAAEAGAEPRRLRRPAALLGADARAASPISRDRIAGLYDHVLVDEYQDTNLLQARILRGMCRTHTQHHRRRRRRAEHLLVPRRELPEHPRLPRRSSRARRSSRSSRTTARRSRSSTSPTR